MIKTKAFFSQIIKYGVVGVLNTLLTAIIIWLVLFFLSNNTTGKSYSTNVMLTANLLGYIAGVINSFILNRSWTFKSKSDWKVSLVRFLIAFGICYSVQLMVVLWLNNLNQPLGWQIDFGDHSFVVTSAYTCQLLGIVVYFVLNFLFNKYYTFKTGPQYVNVSAEKEG